MFWWLAVMTYRSTLQKNCQHQLNKLFSWWMLKGQNPTKYRLAPWIILVATGHWFLSIQQVLLLPYQLLRIAIKLERSCFIYCNNYLWSSAHVSQVGIVEGHVDVNGSADSTAHQNAWKHPLANGEEKNYSQTKEVLSDSLKWLMLPTNSSHFFTKHFDFLAHKGISWYFSDRSTRTACG